MRIEFFASEKIMLLYGTDTAAVVTLRDRVAGLASGVEERFAVHELPGFEAVDGCQLFFSTGKWNRGAFLARAPNTVEFTITPPWWDNVAGLLEPFCLESTTRGQQYLDYGFLSDITPVISRDRGW
jgi:hypothetical protein